MSRIATRIYTVLLWIGVLPFWIIAIFNDNIYDVICRALVKAFRKELKTKK